MNEQEEFEFRLRLEQEQGNSSRPASVPFGQAVVDDVKELGSGFLSGVQMFSPANLNSPTPEKANQIYDAVKGIGPSLLNRGKELVSDPVGSFQRRPVSTLIDVASVGVPALRATRSIPGVTGAMAKTSNAIRQNVTAPLARRSIGLTKQFLNKTASDLPKANQAALTALDSGIIRNPITNPLSSGADDMMARAQSLDTSTGKSIGNFLGAQGEKFDWGDALKRLDEVERRFPADPSVRSQVQSFRDTIRKTAYRHGGELPFEEANKIKSYLQNKINWKSDKASAEVGQSGAGAVRGSIDDQLEVIANKGGTGEKFGKFKQDKKLFGDLQTIQKGLLNKQSAESGNMLVSLPSLVLGGAAFTQVGGLKAVATAIGAELLKRYGSAAGATMSNNVAKLLAGNPSKYTPIINQALATGGTIEAVETALKTDPEFAKIIQIPTVLRGGGGKAAAVGTGVGLNSILSRREQR